MKKDGWRQKCVQEEKEPCIIQERIESNLPKGILEDSLKDPNMTKKQEYCPASNVGTVAPG